MPGLDTHARGLWPALPPLSTGPDFKPNLWMWVNPNRVFPPGKLEVPEPGEGEDLTRALPSPQPPSKVEDFANCSGAMEGESLPPSSSEQSSPPKMSASCPCNWEVGISGGVGQTWGCRQGGHRDTSQSSVFLGITKVNGPPNELYPWVEKLRRWPWTATPSAIAPLGQRLWSRDQLLLCLLQLTEEEEAKDQEDSTSVALPSTHKRVPLQRWRLRQASSQEGRLWSRPPLNYFHLIALALRNSSPCGLNVQQIYSFTQYVPGAL